MEGVVHEFLAGNDTLDKKIFETLNRKKMFHKKKLMCL
jgi:hypothetical protein